jgi:hypothetical protein
LKDNKPSTAVYELKICHTDRLPISAVKSHQVTALLEAKELFYHKISDASFGLKSFDCIFLNKPKAYVAILFFIPRKRKVVTLITIDEFIKIKEKGLSFEMAKSISELTFNL